jgi:hypothetical protein
MLGESERGGQQGYTGLQKRYDGDGPLLLGRGRVVNRFTGLFNPKGTPSASEASTA